MNTKSGGETQTPFYISILASIANEYRIGLEEEESNTPRLILFDEAFNKMDSERIKESIELLMKDARTNSQAFYEKYKETIDDFFAKITEAPGANDEERREIIDKNISLYTDYRTYLDFDLLVTNNETSQVQSLAKSMNTKSGGETQTPFYISILASIANEYRIGLGLEESNTPRLILFDEAFNKMDSERIKESIELLKRFNLQAVLVAPPEKVSDIAPLVDRNLCVIRRRNNAFVKWFDKSEIAEYAPD
jgi:uncharacterized protein YPO0396